MTKRPPRSWRRTEDDSIHPLLALLASSSKAIVRGGENPSSSSSSSSPAPSLRNCKNFLTLRAAGADREGGGGRPRQTSLAKTRLRAFLLSPRPLCQSGGGGGGGGRRRQQEEEKQLWRRRGTRTHKKEAGVGSASVGGARPLSEHDSPPSCLR